MPMQKTWEFTNEMIFYQLLNKEPWENSFEKGHFLVTNQIQLENKLNERNWSSVTMANA